MLQWWLELPLPCIHRGLACRCLSLRSGRRRHRVLVVVLMYSSLLVVLPQLSSLGCSLPDQSEGISDNILGTGATTTAAAVGDQLHLRFRHSAQTAGGAIVIVLGQYTEVIDGQGGGNSRCCAKVSIGTAIGHDGRWPLL